MPKINRGRSKFSAHVAYSPHPRKAIKELRELGVTDKEIDRFRREAVRYRKIEDVIVNKNRNAGIFTHTTVPSYESLIHQVKSGRTVSGATQALKESRTYFEQTGGSLDVLNNLKSMGDLVRDVLGTDFGVNSLNNLSPSQIAELQRLVDRYNWYKSKANEFVDENGELIDEESYVSAIEIAEMIGEQISEFIEDSVDEI